MNREIKFRVWDGALKNWQQEIVFPTKFAELEPKYVGISFPIYPIGSENRFLFQQYTGLKDKNGKEIYEGDIVKFHRWNSPIQSLEDYLCSSYKKICFGLDCGAQYPSVGYIAININPADLEDGHTLNYMDQFNIEVIGNIHENPELIK